MKYQRKEISGFPKYEIDVLGNVYSKYKTNAIRSKDGKLATRINTSGYEQMKLYEEKECKQLLVHRLVYQTFIGDIPENMTVDHIDHDRTNNIVTNLQLLPAAENIKRSWDRRGRSKIKPIVLDWLSRGYDRKFICDNLDISNSYISIIINEDKKI
jgi:hypothetical protein